MDFKNLRRWFLQGVGVKARPESRVFTSALHSSVEPASQEGGASILHLKICGSFYPQRSLPRTIVRVTTCDVTHSSENPLIVLGSSSQWQLDETGKFCFIGELGPLPNSVTTIDSWTTVAQINPNWMVLPHSGRRTLKFSLAIFGFDDPRVVASSECLYAYENPSPGYIDLGESSERARVLMVTIAFSVIGADGKFSKDEVALIKQWAKQNISGPETSEKNKKQLERALNKTISLLRGGSTIYTDKVCRELVKIAGQSELIDAMEFWLLVARAGGKISGKKIKLLKQIAELLMIEKNTFLLMVQKFLSLETCEVRDEEMFLGLHGGMGKEETRRLLNEQYKKWSSRVTNFNPQVRNQAENMLRLIAQARSQFIK